MAKRLDLVGKTFNRLTVLYEVEPINQKSAFMCRCICGTEKVIIGVRLKSNNTKSCGCLHYEEVVRRRYVDLTNKRFTRLLVIKETELRNDFGAILWECKCDCGEILYVDTHALKDGRKTSCGCYLKDRIKNGEFKKGNKYDLSNDYGIVYASNTDKEYMFDKLDYEKIKHITWYEDRKGYAIGIHCGKKYFIHKIVMENDIELGNMVDHHDRNIKDNRKSNLRIVSRGRNAQNSKLNKHNKSGTKGVCYKHKDSIWVSDIMCDKIKYYLGSYKNKEDAIRIREIAELLLFKEYSSKYIELKEKYANEDTSDVEAIIKKKQESIQDNT